MFSIAAERHIPQVKKCSEKVGKNCYLNCSSVLMICALPKGLTLLSEISLANCFRIKIVFVNDQISFSKRDDFLRVASPIYLSNACVPIFTYQIRNPLLLSDPVCTLNTGISRNRL